MAFKAIIFDCFGVLVASSYEPFKKQYLSHDQSLIEKFMQIEDASSAGNISLEEATAKFAELAGISVNVATRELSTNPKNVELLDFIRAELKDAYKIGMLSNVADDRLHELFDDNDKNLFDDIVLSYQVGIAKPTKEIYMLAASRLGLHPTECIFVDDVYDYVDGARQAGMSGILFTNVQDLKRRLVATDSSGGES